MAKEDEDAGCLVGSHPLRIPRQGTIEFAGLSAQLGAIGETERKEAQTVPEMGAREHP